MRAKLRDGIKPVEGTGSKLEADAAAVAVMAGAAATDVETERAADLAQLKVVQDKLTALQGETPLILPTVDYQAVAAVVGDWTGIPVGRMARNEIETILKVADSLAQRVIGQDHAMHMIAKRIQTSRAGLDNPSKPIGVFMLAGHVGCRQDRDRTRPGRGAVRRRAEPDHDQHERVPGSAHGLAR